MIAPYRLKNDVVNYRKGFLEVTPNIHKGYVNLETWEVSSDVDIADSSWVTDLDSDEQITANIELEITPSDARALAAALIVAADSAEKES